MFKHYAGLRAKMGAGFCRMNDLTVIQTTQVRISDIMFIVIGCVCLKLFRISVYQFLNIGLGVLSNRAVW